MTWNHNHGSMMKVLMGLMALLNLAVAVSAGHEALPLDLPTLHVWSLVMVALGLSVIAVTVDGPWRVAGLVTATVLGGFSAQLGLTQPTWFPSIKLFPQSLFEYLLFFMIAVELGVVAWALYRHTTIAHGLRLISSFGAVRIALVALLMVLLSESVMANVGDWSLLSYGAHLVAAGGLCALHLGGAIALGSSLPAKPLQTIANAVSTRISFPGTRPRVRSLDRLLPRIVAVWVLLVCSLLAVLAFERLPHLEDEATYLFQARLLAQGRLSVPAPPPSAAEALKVYLLDVRNGEWFAVTSPGWPLVLAAGVAVGLPWLVNPLLAALSILLAHTVIRHLADRGTANLALLLIGVSPWLLETSSTMMLHTLTLAALLAAWTALLRARAGRAPLFLGLLAGASMGLIFLARPYEGLIFGFLTGCWALSFLSRRAGWRIVAGYGAGCLGVGHLLLLFNARFTGRFSTFPMSIYLDELWHEGANRLGFGADIGPPNSWGAIDVYRGHSIKEALLQAQHSAQALNLELFAWGFGSLLIVLAFLFWGRLRKLDISMISLAAITFLAYSLYWGPGTFFIGPRYWFMAFLPLVVLTARGFPVLARKLIAATDSTAATRLATVAVVFSAIALSSFLTWRSSMRYSGYRGCHRGYIDLVRSHDLENGLVFVKTSLDADYQSAFILNPLDLEGSSAPVFVRDLGLSQNKKTISAFPERRVFYVDGPFGETKDLEITRRPIAQDDSG